MDVLVAMGNGDDGSNGQWMQWAMEVMVAMGNEGDGSNEQWRY